jgi:RimJ/RimL family protein N-acetyltransferase
MIFRTLSEADIGPSGLLISEGGLSLRIIPPCDFEEITALRNRQNIRKYFVDSRLIDSRESECWLAHASINPHDCLVAIWDDLLQIRLGVAGWVRVCSNECVYEAGRMILDPAALRSLAGRRRKGVGVQAARLALRYLFEGLGAQEIRTRTRSDNVLSLHLQRALGFIAAPPVDQFGGVSVDGSAFQEQRLSIRSWQRRDGGSLQ